MRKSTQFSMIISSLRRQAPLLAVLALLCLGPGPAAAADIAVLGGAGAYDLAADGATFSMSLRASQPVSRWVRVDIQRREIGKELSASVTDFGAGLALRLW